MLKIKAIDYYGNAEDGKHHVAKIAHEFAKKHHVIRCQFLGSSKGKHQHGIIYYIANTKEEQ